MKSFKSRFQPGQPLTAENIHSVLEELVELAPGAPDEKYICSVRPTTGSPYLYRCCNCTNHEVARDGVITGHRTAGRPMPVGTTVTVLGICHQVGCDCGGRMRELSYIIMEDFS